LFGAKAGIRRSHFGVFGKARPGFFYISKGELFADPNIRFFRAPEGPQSQFKFAIDIGGIVEFYTSKRSFIRVDLGDTMIPFARSPYGDISIKDMLSHNVQLNIGLSLRF
jgi:hypothetical protein